MTISFREKIYALTRTIPRGKVATYGQLARLAGNPKAARAVGSYMRTNPDAPHTPCHRVVAKDGKLTGYSMGEGISTKKRMLKEEGVQFIKEKVNLRESLWINVI
jgi:O-6-methylguanine DNA methyltransferase